VERLTNYFFQGTIMLKSFVFQDSAGNTYRNVARSLTAAIEKLNQDHGVSENDIATLNQNDAPSGLSI
jgi:hypothetical protein